MKTIFALLVALFLCGTASAQVLIDFRLFRPRVAVIVPALVVAVPAPVTVVRQVQVTPVITVGQHWAGLSREERFNAVYGLGIRYDQGTNRFVKLYPLF